MNIKGTNGNDSLSGGATNDLLSGRRGEDLLEGNDGGDILRGGCGDDTLMGGFSGDDLLSGGRGHDVLIGSIDDDVMVGGKGADKFHFLVSEDFSISGVDRVLDFKPGKDRILIHVDSGNNPAAIFPEYEPATGLLAINGFAVARLAKYLDLRLDDAIIV